MATAMLRAGRIVLLGFGLLALGDLFLSGVLGASLAGDAAGLALAVSGTFLLIDLAGLVGTMRRRIWGPVVLAILMGLLALITRTYDGPWWHTAVWVVGAAVAVAVGVGLDRENPS